MNKKGASQESLNNVDAEISELINNDLNRQNTHIHLIASENFASKAVMEASGSILTNKYSEGFPGRRYYEGCETVDQIEQLAIELLKITGPLAVTSANRSGENDITSDTEAQKIFGENVAEYLEGASVHGSGSTIIDFRVEGGEILREGPLKWPPSYC